MRDNREAPWQSLTESSVKRQYRAGQHIVCDVDCSVTLYFCGTGTQEPISKRLPEWYPIIHAYRAPPPPKDANPNNLLRKAQFSPPNPRVFSESSVNLTATIISELKSGSSVSRGAAAGPGESAGATDKKEKEREREKVVTAGATTRESGVKDAVRERLVSPATPGRYEPSSAVDTSPQFSELLLKGNRARTEQNYALAQENYLAAQKARPEDYRGFQGLGNIFADQKNWTAAEQAYRQALKLEPLDNQLNLSLAFVMLETMVASRNPHRAREVEEVLSAASWSNPADERAYALYDRLIEFAGADLAQTKTLVQRAVLYSPRSTAANLRLARFLFRVDRPDEALSYVRIAEKHADRDELLAVARMYEVHGRYKDAERSLTY